ncbi:hypothetical protein pdam_00007187 [Pocillopora damicornis]|uniref:RNA-binding region-containing protein 3 n=1 Tax=Pocillopora damicornis TaxID=46731 RepID=A0A3M6USA6_POCDA|nr:hypothetical protein pdam_00007187 [Pocillopora damicornis]
MADDMSTKLLVRHLPSQLSVHEKTDLLKHFGAKEVICMERRGKLRDAAFAEFSTQAQTAQAISQLHQSEVLGSRLTVEYAKPHHEHLAAQQCSRVSPSIALDENKNDDKETRKLETEQAGSKVKVKSGDTQGMAPSLGIKYNCNPSLHYVYPPVNTAILTNIAHTLACVPKFYVQVLHLMNKMNLPAPFGQITPTPPFLGEGPEAPQAASSDDDRSMSSDESELESDEEEREKRAKERAEHAQRMSASKPGKSAQKRHKVNLPTSKPPAKKFKASSSTKQIPVEKAFEQPSGQPKRIEFKLIEAISNIFESAAYTEATAVAPPEAEGFGRFAPPADLEDDKDELEEEEEEEESFSEDSSEFISSAELRRNRISTKEMPEISAFKNYTPGDPTCRLYIKNLAKTVEEKHEVCFSMWIKTALFCCRFDIRLMKEGRMKGQAFVTLPSEEKAKKALRDAHGYILQGKPMVIVSLFIEFAWNKQRIPI